METGRRSLVEELFHEAADLPPAERPAFLDRMCGGDEDLRRQVASLLAADTPDEFLQAAVNQVVHELPLSVDESWELIDTRIGRYLITGLIGKGGMGAVYRAVRTDDFQMQVALKLLKRGTETETALNRFRSERQILANLQHPNIARLFDGGATEAELPYFVMEYVDGTPLLEYAAPLTIHQRVEIFRAICSAVEYAHQHRVIHRDIKPANILVTRDGTPKLLDFGIAKLVAASEETNGATLTLAGARVMTPDYASPEQVRGEPVTAATDIYSLGAVLYELLTGHRAHHVEKCSPSEIEREICTQEPKKPSAVARDLDADLDNIVLKALRKEPERRYRSVAEFAEDLDRFLHDLPVKARKESLLYRAHKFLKRNRIPTLAAVLSAALVLTVIAGLGRSGKTDHAPSAALQRNDTKWDRFRFEKIASLGDPAPGGGTFTTYFEPWAQNNQGDLVFVSEVLAGKGEALFLLRRGRGPPIPLARPGQPAPGGGTFEGVSYGYASLNDSGDVAFVYGLKASNPNELKGFGKAGLYLYSHRDQQVVPIVVPGVTPAPGFGVFRSTEQHATINNSGDIVFPGLVQTSEGMPRKSGLGLGIFVAHATGQITELLAPGDPATGGGKFDFVLNPWINDAGDVAFGGHVAGEECISMGFGHCAESIYLKRANSDVESIAHQGEQAPQSDRYTYAWGPVLNNRGDLVFIADLTPLPGVQAPRGIYLHSQGITTPIALPGNVMPDGGKILTVNPARVIGNYSLNNRGDISFNASLENSGSAFYVYSQGGYHLIAGTGTVIPGVGTISSVSNFLVNGGILNDSGQIFFWATLTDGRGVMLLATPQPQSR